MLYLFMLASTARAPYSPATEYKYSVRINDNIINISSTNLELLNVSI